MARFFGSDDGIGVRGRRDERLEQLSRVNKAALGELLAAAQAISDDEPQVALSCMGRAWRLLLLQRLRLCLAGPYWLPARAAVQREARARAR